MMALIVYDFLLWAGLLVLIVALGAVVARLRRRAFKELPPESMEMTIDQLEQLLADGVISEEEFRQLRPSVLGLPGREMQTDAAPAKDAQGRADGADIQDEAGPPDGPDADETERPSPPT